MTPFAPKRARTLGAAIGIAICVAAAGPVACRAQPSALSDGQAPSASPAALEKIPLRIESGGQVHHFTVEVARSGDEQARGLMFRESLGPDEGMIFPFERPRIASFWMRNTLIPLDMIFIRSDGTIERIAGNTTPLSDEPVSSIGYVTAVLELRGGRAAELGIAEGDRVVWNR